MKLHRFLGWKQLFVVSMTPQKSPQVLRGRSQQDIVRLHGVSFDTSLQFLFLGVNEPRQDVGIHRHKRYRLQVPIQF
jgi:hypothetical protein